MTKPEPSKILQSLVGKSVEEIVQAIKDEKITAQYILDSIYPSLSAEQRLPFHKAILTFGMPDPWTYEGHVNYLRAGNDAIVALYELQDWDQALPIADEFYQAALAPSGPNSTNTYLAHSVAAIYMKFDKIDKVLKLIANALDNNYDQAESIETGPDFEPLKKDPRFIELFKKYHKKKESPKASSNTYHVEFKKVTGVKVPKLLKDFAQWLRIHRHGSVGYFDVFGTWPIGDGMNKKTIKETLSYLEEFYPGLLHDAIAIMTLPDGGELYLHNDGRVIHADSEGSDPELIADSFAEFLTLLAEAETGVNDLDDVDEENNARDELKEWLKETVK